MSGKFNLSHEFWKVGSINLHVVTAGEGEPVLLLHGFPEIWYSWRKVIPRLSRKYRIIAPDLRGYGQSEIPLDGYDIDTLSQDIVNLIDKIGGNATIISHDWGGVIGWHVAMTHPDKVKALIPIAGPLLPEYFRVMLMNPLQFLKSQYVLFFQIPYLPEYLLTMGNGKLPSKLLEWSSYRPEVLSNDDMGIYRKSWSNIASMRAGLNYYRQLLRNAPKVLKYYSGKKIKCPVCVVWGDKDWFLSLSLTKNLEKYCDVVLEVRIIPNCGHWIQQEAPDELNDIIETFMDKIK